jgi:hypothetical protein
MAAESHNKHGASNGTLLLDYIKTSAVFFGSR